MNLNKKKKALNIRKYLSPVSSKEGSDIKITATEFNGGYVDAHVSIRDCNRGVTLGFYYEDPKGKVEKIKKLEVLINELTKLRDWMKK